MSLKPYKGAGLLIMALMPDSEPYILLGKRKHNPGKGAWSFPGGGKEHNDPSFAHTALREGREEIRCRELDSLDPQQLVPLVSYNLIYYEWVTYGAVLHCPSLPEVSILHEFSELQWFPARHLPAPLHWGVRPAVTKALQLLPGLAE
jgi:8-oxo-dGTP pyrophosphatase MutT (NUDIX family)